MKKTRFLLIFLLICGGVLLSAAQEIKTPKTPVRNDAATEREVREFFDAYAEDLRLSRREAIADRYDRRGVFFVGNGSKTLVSFEDTKKRYLNNWTGPKSFAWKDLSIEILSPEAAIATGLFDWESASGWTVTFSYTGVLKKSSGKWSIRLEDESVSTVPWTINHLVGDRSKAGAFKYTLKAPPGASIAAHRHSVEMRVTVVSGRVCLLMGDFSADRVQCFETGGKFTIPAGTWHVEWWEAPTHVEVEGTGPMLTEMASPSTPRKP